MDFFPKYSLKPLSEVEPGELFFIEVFDVWMTALRAVETEGGNEKLLALLGPTFPDRTSPAMLASWGDVTVMSLGSDFKVRLSTSASAWSHRAPDTQTIALVLLENELHLRANYSVYPGEFNGCLVKIRDGSVRYRHQHGLRAYTKEWELQLENGDELHSILKWPPA